MGHLYDDECPECEAERRTFEEKVLFRLEDDKGVTKATSDWFREWVKHPENRANALTPVATGPFMSFTAILDEISDLHERKQSDYGRVSDPYANVRASEDFGIAGWLGAVIRANDKMRRLQKFAIQGNLTNESVEDSLLDLATYIIIALDLYRQENNSEWKEAWRD